MATGPQQDSLKQLGEKEKLTTDHQQANQNIQALGDKMMGKQLKRATNEGQQAIKQHREVSELKQALASASEQLIANEEPKALSVREKDKEIDQLATKLDQATQDNQLTLCHEMKSSEENCAALQQTTQQQDREVSELRQELASKNEKMQGVLLEDEKQAPSKRPVTMWRWQSLPDIPAGVWYGSSAVIGDKIYIMAHNGYYVICEFSENKWSTLPSCPSSSCTIVNIDDKLTTVGGMGYVFLNYALYSYIDNKWVEFFPAMPTPRFKPAAVYANNTLVVAGGKGHNKTAWFGHIPCTLNTVELLNIANRQWSNVSSLPMLMYYPSATICGDYVYIHPRTYSQKKVSVYKCSLEQLAKSQPSTAIWENITSLPVGFSSLVTVNGHLLAVGGDDPNHTNNIYQYANSSWTIVSQMESARSTPATAVLPNNKLMVVGGFGASNKCELGTIIA